MWDGSVAASDATAVAVIAEWQTADEISDKM